MKAFELPIYEDRLKIYIGVKEWAKWHKACLKANMAEATLLKTDEASAFENLLWLRDFRRTPRLISILVHELYHFTEWFSGFHGIYDEEALAYLLEYLIRTILEEGV